MQLFNKASWFVKYSAYKYFRHSAIDIFIIILLLVHDDAESIR